MYRRLLLSSAATLVLVSGCTPSKTHLIDNGPGVTRAPLRASLFVRAVGDSDASNLIGQWIPDDVDDSQVDESVLMRTVCSDYIKPKSVTAAGRTNEVFAATQGFGGSVSVPNVAKASFERGSTGAVRIDYQLAEKLQADVDSAGLRQCCADYPDQCTKRYVASAVRGTGYSYTATEESNDFGGEGEGSFKGIQFGASAFYKDGFKWERNSSFDNQFFAFGLGRYSAPAAVAACTWAKGGRLPKDPNRTFFMGDSQPLPTEADANKLAERRARERVVEMLGEWLASASVTNESLSGLSDSLQKEISDKGTVERVSQGIASMVQIVEYCPESRRGSTGYQYVSKVLAVVDNGQLDKLRKVALEQMKQVLEAKGQLTPQTRAALQATIDGM